MKENIFIKISAAIFILLAVIISLFPPFEFNKSLKSIQAEAINSHLFPQSYYSYNSGIIKLNPSTEMEMKNIVSKLPIKKYDFLLGNNKKYFALDSYKFQKYFTENSLQTFKEKWNDKKFKFIASVDSFFTAKRFLYNIFFSFFYSKKKEAQLWRHLYNEKLSWEEINDKIDYKKYGLANLYETLDEFHFNENLKKNYAVNYPDYFWSKTNYTMHPVNYWMVKREYDKEPVDWKVTTLFQFDSTGNYDKYLVTQPVYYLLDRKILLSELMVEYILAFFVSIIVGYLISKLKLKKSANQNFNL